MSPPQLTDHFQPIDDIEHLIPDEARGTSREAEWREQLYLLYDVPQFDKLFLQLRLCHLELEDYIVRDCMRVDIAIPRQPVLSFGIVHPTHPIDEQLHFAAVRIGMSITFKVVILDGELHCVVCAGSWIAQESLKVQEFLIDLLPEGTTSPCGTLRITSLAYKARDFRLYCDDGLFPASRWLGSASAAILDIYSTVCTPAPEVVTDILRRLSSAAKVDADGRVFDIGSGQLVKRAGRLLAREAVATEYVRRHTSIPVPRIYAFFEHEGLGHMVMDHMRGTPLVETIVSLSPGDRNEICEQLRRIVAELRTLPAQDSLGGWPCGPYNNIDFREPEPSLPFPSTEEFWHWWLRKRRMDLSPPPPALAGNSRFVLAHGDIVPKNILVEGSTVVAILDWETLGTYPDCWEAMVIASQLHPRADNMEELPGWPESDGWQLAAKIGSLLYPLPF